MFGVNDSIYDCSGKLLICDDAAPLTERKIRREDQAFAFVAVRDDLENIASALFVQLTITTPVDDKEIKLSEGVDAVLKSAFLCRGPKPYGKLRQCYELRIEFSVAGHDSETDDNMVLPLPQTPYMIKLFLLSMKSKFLLSQYMPRYLIKISFYKIQFIDSIYLSRKPNHYFFWANNPCLTP